MEKLTGDLRSWNASEHGGFGYIEAADGRRYFTHRKYIKSGNPIPGSSVVFTPHPPAPGKAFPQARDVVINCHTTLAKETRLPSPKVVLGAKEGA